MRLLLRMLCSYGLLLTFNLGCVLLYQGAVDDVTMQTQGLCASGLLVAGVWLLRQEHADILTG